MTKKLGHVPPGRLAVKAGVVYLNAAGKFRRKIGVNPRRSKHVLGGHAADSQVLIIVQFSQPDGVTDYVNAPWKLQDNPYGGGVANSCNEGPPAPGGKALGAVLPIGLSLAVRAAGPRQEDVARPSHDSFDRSGRSSGQSAGSVPGVSLEDVKGAFAP